MFPASVFKQQRAHECMAPYDIVGNIAIVKFRRETKASEKKRVAAQLLRQHAQLITVLEKTGRFKGRLRAQKTRYIAGERMKEAVYRENGCVFRLDVDRCYFSPRLASERKKIAEMVKEGERVLVMFGGVAPFAIVIARLAKPKCVVSMELSRACTRYARENVLKNKVQRIVETVQGDVRRLIPKVKEKFDRVVMPRPNLRESFLSFALRAVKKGGVIQYYGFYRENEREEMKRLIESEARKARKKVKIIRVKKAGNIGVRRYRWRADLRVN